MSEQQIQSKILKYLEDESIYAVKVMTANRAGTPDILACVRGTFVGIEVKSPAGKTSKLQDYALANIRKSGGEAWIVRSVEDVADLLSHFPNINHNEAWRGI